MRDPASPLQFALDLWDPQPQTAPGNAPGSTSKAPASPQETPEAIFGRVFRSLRPRTPLPEIGIDIPVAELYEDVSFSNQGDTSA